MQGAAVIRTGAALALASDILTALDIPIDGVLLELVASRIQVGVANDELRQAVETKATVHLLRSKQ